MGSSIFGQRSGQKADERRFARHSRYRKAGKITDEDLLHTLGDGAGQIFAVINREEWRPLTDTEKCAMGIFYKTLGDDMRIPYHLLPSNNEWRDGLHFVNELVDWVHDYEKRVCRPTESSKLYVASYVDSAMDKLPSFLGRNLKAALAADLNEEMRKSMWSVTLPSLR